MKNFAEHIKDVYELYHKITKSFTFHYEIDGHACTIHAYIGGSNFTDEGRRMSNVNDADFVNDKEDVYKEKYRIDLISTSKTMAPQNMGIVYVEEKMLFNKGTFFYKDENMFNKLIDFIKEEWKKIENKNNHKLDDKPKNKETYFREMINASNCFVNILICGDHFIKNTEEKPKMPDEILKYIFDIYKNEIKKGYRGYNYLDIIRYEEEGDSSFFGRLYLFLRNKELEKVEDFYSSLNIDWEVLELVMTDYVKRYNLIHPSQNDSWKKKYVRYALGKDVEIVKDGKKKIINPRREFFMDFYSIANIHPMVSDELLERIDNLKPIEGLVLQHKAYEDIKIKLTHSILKYFKENPFFYYYDRNKLIPFIIISKGFPRAWWPNLYDGKNETSEDRYSRREEEGRLYDIEIIEEIHKAFEKFYYTYKEKDTMIFINDINCHFRDYYAKLNKIKGDDKDMGTISEEIIDTMELFASKVIRPIAMFLSNRDDTKRTIHTSMTKLMYEFFGEWGKGNLFKIYKMAKIVHDRGGYFSAAGDDPDSLIDYDGILEMNTEMKVVFSDIKKQISSDEIRKKAGLSNEVEWAGIVNKTILTPNDHEEGYHIIPLLSSEQLKEEGEKMNNCVGWGGYANSSSRGRSKIFSIRNSKLERVATLEVSVSLTNGGRFHNIQLYGYKNSEVSQELEDHVSWFINKLNNEENINSVPVEIDALTIEKKVLDKTKETKKHISHLAGYAITEENIRAALVPWKPFLPKELYEAPLSKWLEIKFIRDMVDDINDEV